MKRSLVFALAIALFGACSTKEIDIQTPVQDDVMFYASFEQPTAIDTKVYANEDLLLRWTADDRVSIFNTNTYNQQYAFTGETGDNAGGFRKVDTDEFMTGNAITNVVSVYPYQASTKISENEVITVNLPAEQTYAENTFGLGANTMVSVTSDNFLQYKNVGGYLMLKLYGEGVSVSSITLRGNNGEKLAGKASVTMPIDGVPSVTMSLDATTEITLVCESPIQLGAFAEESTQFWFVVPPMTFEKGFTITVKDSKNFTAKKITSNRIEITRNKLAKMSAFEVIPDPSNDAIVFADQILKEILVAKFDTNGDGELSYSEARSVSSLSEVFSDESSMSIESFDEFAYFTGVIEIPSYCFKNWASLSSIVLPETLQIINTEAFSGCSSLNAIVIPNSVTSIGHSTFKNCTGLRSVVLSSSLKKIPYWFLGYCSSIKEITIPDSVIEIEGDAFAHCSNLESVIVPNSVKTIGAQVFFNCTSLHSVALPSGLITLSNGIFEGCTNLKDVQIPVILERIESKAFRLSGISDVSLGDKIVYIGDEAFANGGPISLTIRALIPPETGLTIFKYASLSKINIFVPEEALNDYRNSEYWSAYATRIQAISSSVPTPETIDLGLSVKWASFNLGATSPEEYGDYYAWGETETKENYTWSTYKWCNGSENTLTKYCTNSTYGYNGFIDTKTVLDLEDDAAYVSLGSKWRMPTEMEWAELRNNCTWTWTTLNGVNGWLVSASNGNSIFLPSAGAYNGYDLRDASSGGYYWSSSLYESNYPYYARYVYFLSSDVHIYSVRRFFGQSVRPVYAE